MSTFVVGETQYEIGKLTPKKAWNLSRRVLGLMNGNILENLAKLPDAESDYIIDLCMQVVTRNNGTRFVPVTTGSGGSATFMFDDIDMPTMMKLCGEVIKENVGDFLAERLSTLGGAAPATSTP
jgi:hypothetical protein